ncbi:MAG TPA: hypothetical protein VGL20_15135 [Candidatus Dormibacteraeota bacterium]
MIAPAEQLVAAVLLTIVSWSTAPPPLDPTPLPRGAALPAIVELVTVTLGAVRTTRPPPTLLAVLPLTVLFSTVRDAELSASIPPPSASAPATVADARLPLTVLLTTVRWPPLRAARPPPRAMALAADAVTVFPFTVLSATVRVAPPSTSSPAAEETLTPFNATTPLRMVTPEIETVPATTARTRFVWFPSMIVRPAPLPVMVTLVAVSISPPVSRIGVPSRLGEKVIVSPLTAAAIAVRSEPGPLSLAVVTVSTAARTTPMPMPIPVPARTERTATEAATAHRRHRLRWSMASSAPPSPMLTGPVRNGRTPGDDWRRCRGDARRRWRVRDQQSAG